MHIVKEKEVYAMTRPVPLMFIKSPSASVQLPEQQEEAVSLILAEDEQEMPSTVAEQLKKIQTPFGRHLYQPLLFKLVDKREVTGVLKEDTGNALVILQDDSADEEITVSIDEIDDILWRGQSLNA